MIKQLLEEVRATPLDEAGRDRLRASSRRRSTSSARRCRPTSRTSSASSPRRSRRATPSEAELRVAQAQLVGWLEGLFHGIQATLFAQQMAARQQLEEMRRGLPPGHPEGGPPPGQSERTGTYL